MGVFALLDGLAALVRGVDDLVGELLAHALARARARILLEPAHRERRRALRPDLDRHLIGGAADTPRLHLDARAHVLERAPEHRQRVVARLALDHLERAVDDVLGGALLAVHHQDVDEPADHPVAVLRIRQRLALRNVASSGHLRSLSTARARTFVRLPRAVELRRRAVAGNGLLRTFGAVLRAAAVPGRHPGGVERAAHDVVADTRQVLHAAAADQHDGVLLEVVPLARDVGVHLTAVGEAHARDLA